MVELEEGTWIELYGMKTLHYNGKQGELVKVASDETNWRAVVQLVAEGRSMRIKPCNIRRFEADPTKLRESFTVIGERNYAELLSIALKKGHDIEIVIELAKLANNALSFYFGNGYAHLLQAYLVKSTKQPLDLLLRHYRRSLASKCFTNAPIELNVIIEYVEVLEEVGELDTMDYFLTRTLKRYSDHVIIRFKHARCLRKLDRKHDSLRLYKTLFGDVMKLDANSAYSSRKEEYIGDYFDCILSIGVDYRVQYENFAKSVEILRDLLSFTLFSSYISSEKSLYAQLHLAAAVVSAGNTLEGRNIVNNALSRNCLNKICDYQSFAYHIFGLAHIQDAENSVLNEDKRKHYEVASNMFEKALNLNISDKSSQVQKLRVERKIESLEKETQT